MSARANSDSKSVALIPARGGSQRIPNKNIREFFGHPMLAYAVAAAQASGLFSRIVVSTDSAEIGRIAEWYGAEFLPRPSELSDGNVGLKTVILHVLQQLQITAAAPAAFCQLMPNCPLRRAEDIVAHHRLFAEHDRKFQISAVPYRGVYPQWAATMNAQGEGSWLIEHREANSQELQTAYCPTGAIWWARTADFLEQKTFYGHPFHLAPMDANRGLDLDTMEDLELAELLVRGLEQRDGRSPLQPVPQKAICRTEKSA